MWEVMAAAAAANLLGTYLGNEAASKDRNAQKAMIQEAKAEFDKLGLPPEEGMNIFYEELKKKAPDYSPEEFKATMQQGTEYDKVKTDPRYKDAQLQSLAALRQVANGGQTLQDKLDVENNKRKMLGQSQAAQQQVLNSLQQRGVSSAGMELASRQQAAQDSANQMAQYQAQVQAQAQQRALEAMMRGGQLASSYRDQDFSEQAKRAQAQDMINQFNAQTTNQAGQYNVGNRNQAQQINNAEAQRIADANVGIRNKGMDTRANAAGQQWDRKMQAAQGKAGQYGNQAQYYGQQAQGTKDMWGGLVQGANQAFGAYGQQQNADRTYDLQKQGLKAKYPNYKWEDEEQ
jgi:hypothetical protein